MKMCRVLEERFKAIEGHDAYGIDDFDLCLVTDVVIPPKFKTPNFDKYKGLVVQDSFDDALSKNGRVIS